MNFGCVPLWSYIYIHTPEKTKLASHSATITTTLQRITPIILPSCFLYHLLRWIQVHKLWTFNIFIVTAQVINFVFKVLTIWIEFTTPLNTVTLLKFHFQQICNQNLQVFCRVEKSLICFCVICLWFILFHFMNKLCPSLIGSYQLNIYRMFMCSLGCSHSPTIFYRLRC